MQPDWDWCHSCGFDPDRQRPERSEDEHDESGSQRRVSRTALVTIVLAVLTGGLLGGLAWAVMEHRSTERELSAAVPDLAPRGNAEEMDDGWWVLEPLDIGLAVQLPVRPERTSVEMTVPGGGELNAPAWVGSDGASTWAVTAVAVDVDWGPPEQLADSLEVPDLGGGEVAHTGREQAEVSGASAARLLTQARSGDGTPASSVVAVSEPDDDGEGLAVSVTLFGDGAEGFERARSSLRITGG